MGRDHLEFQEKIVAELKLEGCPEGRVLNKSNPDPEVDRFFRGWDNPLTPHKYWRRPSNLRIIYEDENPILEYDDPYGRPRCLVTGDDFWKDYTIESEIRIIGNVAKPTPDNSTHLFPWAGIIFRYQDLRHYYFFCLRNEPGDGKVVLYRRADNDWHILAEQPFEIDPNRYYSLKVKTSGNRIQCYVERQESFSVTDYLYRKGKVGLRFNTHTRVKSVKVSMTSGEERIFLSAKKRHQEEIDEESKRYPKPILWKRLDISRFWPFSIYFINLRSSNFKDILLFCANKVVALDINGKVLWEKKEPLRANLLDAVPRGSRNRPNIIYRSNGRLEIPAIAEKENKIVIFDGANGKTLKEAPLPPLKPKPRMWDLKVANLTGVSEPRDIILKVDNSDGGNVLWSYDEDLNLIWMTTVTPRYGHSRSVVFYDVDDDGREEILVGGTLLNPDGTQIWRVEGYQEINWTTGARHVDAVIIGRFADDEDVDPVAFLAAGSAGIWVVDALTGKVKDIHYVGHAQGLSVGEFRPETPGLEVLSGCRWDSYGILNLFSGRGERLLTFEPDNVSQGGPPVNWGGHEKELILLAASSKSIGLWDGFGRRVITFLKKNLPEGRTDYYHQGRFGCVDLCGDSRDEIFFCSRGKIHIFTQS